MTKIFEADLCPETKAPRLRLNFANGWAVSILLREGDGFNYTLASVAACPSGRWGRGKTELLDHEAFPDEVAAFLAQVAARPRPQAVAS